MADRKTRQYLNDLSSRRRVTTLFPNRQSARWGVQENMVNTTKGNLTFLVRDLVRIDSMPIVLGRVYDSTLRDGDDFGPGWKLAVDERIVRRGSRLLYTDATGATYRLRLQRGRIVPVVPALTPIRSGVLRTDLDVRTIVLQSPDLVRHFEKIGEVYRLIAVSHARGSLRLAYQGERLTAITSNNGRVELIRRPDGRTIAARDDHGREVSYAYDHAGRLHKVVDRSGGIWEYRYHGNQSGELTAIIDPRLVTIFEATHRNGRVEWVRALRQETTLTYETDSTKAVDVLGRTKVFHHGRLGITDGIEDASGAFTQVAFDGNHRPVEMMRNGEVVARMEYDEKGRLTSLWQEDGKTAYFHDGKGLTSAEGAYPTRYAYDDAGRVVQAFDERGERTYTYDENGGLASVTMDGIDLQFDTNTAGIITDVGYDGGPLISHVIADDGRVVSTVYGDEARSLAVSHQYNERGFREESTFANGFVAHMSYDDAGNLIRYEVRSPDGPGESQEYEINAFNEVLRIKTDGPQGQGAVSFRYDEAGRVFEVQSGNRGVTVEHDELDRVTHVTLDGETLLRYDYAATDMDVVTAADVLSTRVAVPFGTSGVFGTIESIVYTRPRPMDYGPISLVPGTGTFRVETAHLVPDAVLLSSLERRMMPLRGEPLNGASFGYDKPSNSLFIPPEYFSVNCHICSGTIYRASLQAPNVLIGDETDITIQVVGDCTVRATDSDEEEGDRQQSPWYSGVVRRIVARRDYRHLISLGDGTTLHRSSPAPSGSVRIGHTYQRPNTYYISDDISCGCSSPLGLMILVGTTEVRPLCPVGIRCCNIRDFNNFWRCAKRETLTPVSTNGCNWPSTNKMRRIFRSDCNKHDTCYGTCPRTMFGGRYPHWTTSKRSCDDAFLQDMYRTCRNPANREGEDEEYCRGLARSMHRAVSSSATSLVSTPLYISAQKRFCRCCHW